MDFNIKTIKDEAKSYADVVRKEIPVDRVILFGSYAKGTATAKSDVDIAFFVPDFTQKSRFDVGVLLLSLTQGFKAYFEPLVFSTQELLRDNPFVNEIVKTGIEIQ